MNKRTDAGFTLIELMAAMTIMSVGLFAIVHMGAVSTRGIAYARELSNASLLAQSVAQELSTRSTQWTGRVGQNFADVFPDINLQTLPAQGDNFTPSSMRSLEYLQGNQIANNTDFTDAMPINNWAQSPYDSTDDGLLDEGALYRVYLVASNWTIAASGAPSPNIVQVQIYVMWDNKDHGKQASWKTVTTEDFWDRHWVYSDVTLIRNQNVIQGGA